MLRLGLGQLLSVQLRNPVTKLSFLSQLRSAAFTLGPKPTFNSASTMASVPTNDQFIELMKVRRSNYALSKESTISESELKKILENVLEQAPSTFGSYTTRLVVLLDKEHQELWDLITEIVKGASDPERFESHTKARLQGFQNSYGTVLFYEDTEGTEKLKEMYPPIKNMFPDWGHHTSAMHQWMIWTALSNAGMGANLQHYNPLIDEKVMKKHDIPPKWSLVAQLVFGKPTAEPGPKPTHMKKPLPERLVIKGTRS